MEKNYNYNYENRSQGQKLPIGYSNLGVSSCTSNVLDKSPVTNGSLWHTTDKNEFYYDWNGSRIKLNLTGDNASISAELEKIKEEIKNLDPDAVKDIVKELETKVNSAVSTVNTLKITVEDAAKVAQDAAAQVENKADASKVNDLENALGNKADADTVNTLSGKVDSFQGAIDAKADSSTVNTLSGRVDGLETALTEKANSADVESAINAAVADKADANVVKALETTVAGKVNQDAFNELKDTVNKIQIPTKVSKFENDKNYITYLDIKDDLLTTEDRAALDAIKDLGASDVETGKFPVVDLDTPTDPTEAALDGLATVQDVMTYVNALIEKKKGELVPSGEVKDYLYVNGVSYTDDNVLPTPGTIYDMNCYEISDTLISDGLKVYVGPEILGFNEGDSTTTIYSEVFSVDVPTGYSIEVHTWDSDNKKWFDAVQPMMSNPKQATKLYGGKTYNCFVRTLDDNFNDARTVSVRYKIIINKNQ